MSRTLSRAGAMAALGGSAALVATALAGPATAHDDEGDHLAYPSGGPVLQYVGTFDVTTNGTEVAEIVDLSADGRTAVYSDAGAGKIGFVDVSDPSAPVGKGSLEVGGSPTSVALLGDLALVAIDTSPSFVAPSGSLQIVDVKTRTVVRTLDLGGQPDSVAISPDKRYAAVVIENQRDEDLNDGLIPQLPGGGLVVVDLVGSPAGWTTRFVDLAGLAEIAPEDAEAEFVDIDDRNRAVVTLQENNHVAVVDLRRARVVGDFPAGSVTLENVDATEEEIGPQGNGIISFTETITKRREPDTVQWIGPNLFATANEGDYEDANGDEGGSRGFTVFNGNGRVVFESGPGFEHALASAGHYPEGRSANKGVEPEALEFGHIHGLDVLVVGSERGNALGVYDVSNPRRPELRQILPTGIGPEGIKINEKRGLMAVANETSVDDLVPSMITFYQAVRRGQPEYPQLVSEFTQTGAPIPWVAMSALVADDKDRDILWAASDSILGDGFLYRIDVSQEPAVITDRIPVTDPDAVATGTGFAAGGGFFPDIEGVALAPEGGFWLASEGRNGARPNAIVRTDDYGAVKQIVELPAALAAGATNNGFEGVAVTEAGGVTEYVYVAVQREFRDDPANQVKIGRYEVATGEWTFVRYEKAPAANSAIGLSEITLLPDGSFAIIERDGSLGTDAVVKKIYRVELAGADFRPFGEPLVTVPKTELYDLLDELTENSVWTPDKLEGFAVARNGKVYAVTDNDGLDDAIGQTLFLRLGKLPAN